MPAVRVIHGVRQSFTYDRTVQFLCLLAERVRSCDPVSEEDKELISASSHGGSSNLLPLPLRLGAVRRSVPGYFPLCGHRTVSSSKSLSRGSQGRPESYYAPIAGLWRCCQPRYAGTPIGKYLAQMVLFGNDLERYFSVISGPLIVSGVPSEVRGLRRCVCHRALLGRSSNRTALSGLLQ